MSGETPDAVCAYKVDVGSDFHPRYEACGRKAYWALADGSESVPTYGSSGSATGPFCRLHKANVSRSWHGRRIKFVPILGENGCPLCAGPLDGVAPNRMCPDTKKCGYDEAEALNNKAAMALAEVMRIEGLKSRPFTEREVSEVLRTANNLDAAMTELNHAFESTITRWDDSSRSRIEAADARLADALVAYHTALDAIPVIKTTVQVVPPVGGG